MLEAGYKRVVGCVSLPGNRLVFGMFFETRADTEKVKFTRSHVMFRQPKPLRVQFSTAVLCLIIIFAGNLKASQVPANDNIAMLDRSAKAFATVVKSAEPAVVHVAVEKSVSRQTTTNSPYEFFNDPFFERFFGPQFRSPYRSPDQQKEYKQRGAGSGFIVGSDGYILTNNHVVEGADKISVRLDDKREFKAKVIGTDPQSDVAVIKIDASDLPVLPLGDSDSLEVGEWVIAIGNPFELSSTVTVGVVSAKGRNHMGINDYENFIQTDAAINPGNSGGPLLNIHGEAIGINTAIFSRSGGYMGIGFAIPINMAKAIKKQLVQNGKVTRGWLGVMIQDVSEDLAKSFHLEEATGVLVSEITKNSPAEKGGLKQGDVLLNLNGVPLEGVADLRNKIAMTSPDSTIKMDVIRDGEQKSLSLTVGEQPQNMNVLAGKAGPGLLSDMGLTLQDLTDELADHFGYQIGQGVLITDVAPDSPASDIGLKPGQLIEEINRIRVASLSDVKSALAKSQTPGQVLLRIRSGNYSQYVVIREKK